MHFRKLILIALLLSSIVTNAQNTTITAEEADAHSYQLYLEGKWNELLQYGKDAIKHEIDFPYLRLRIAYAAVMTEHFSEAIKQYEKVLEENPQNELALYYSKYCRQMLNHNEVIFVYDEMMNKLASPELYRADEKKSIQLSEIGSEFSYKHADTSSRGNSSFIAAKFMLNIGKRLQLTQSFISYNQTISEPWFTSVTNNDAINISQKEYYAKIAFALDRHWVLKGVYHFIQTPFNNFSFNNHAGMLGVKYYGDYYNLQGNIIASQLSDSMVQQLEIQADYYPAGNLNIYGNSCVSLQFQSGKQQINWKQVLGFKMSKSFWLEANATIGQFNNRFENEAYYVYNAVDPNMYKFGLSAFWYPSKHLQVQLGATFEKRTLLKTDYIFNQQSINGGISWKF